MSDIHEGIACNVCVKQNFKGLRFKCLLCVEYDSCQDCYDSRLISYHHNSKHPMQAILTKSDYNIYYFGEDNNEYEIRSFVCPICCISGLSSDRLKTHVLNEHVRSLTRVICPLCITVDGRNWDAYTVNLAQHFITQHSCQLESVTCNENHPSREHSLFPDVDLDFLLDMQMFRSLGLPMPSTHDEPSLPIPPFSCRRNAQVEVNHQGTPNSVLPNLAHAPYGYLWPPSPPRPDIPSPPPLLRHNTVGDEQSPNGSEVVNRTFTVESSEEISISGGQLEANESGRFLLPELLEEQSVSEGTEDVGLRMQLIMEQMTSMVEAANQEIASAEQYLRELENIANIAVRGRGAKRTVDTTERMEEEGL